MARYSVKRCPNCRDDFWVTISHPSPTATELPITAYCALCGFELKGWRLIVGGKRPKKDSYRWLRKVVK
jgi:hypothetical protein